MFDTLNIKKAYWQRPFKLIHGFGPRTKPLLDCGHRKMRRGFPLKVGPHRFRLDTFHERTPNNAADWYRRGGRTGYTWINQSRLWKQMILYHFNIPRVGDVYASVKKASISDHRLPVQHQTITWMNADLLMTDYPDQTFWWNFNKSKTISKEENWFNKFVCFVSASVYKGNYYHGVAGKMRKKSKHFISVGRVLPPPPPPPSWYFSNPKK